MAALSVLAIAVASGKAGYVFLCDGKLQDWGVTVQAVRTGTDLVGFVQDLINELRPDVVVSEDCSAPACRKGPRARKLIQSIAELASHNDVLDVSVPRLRLFPSKYEEADALACEHEELVGYLPVRKRRIFDFEPRAMMLFEALVLAKEAMEGPPSAMVAATG